MKLGLNLSFAVKRWMEPDVLAALVHQDLGVNHVQFSWDIIDPWWPAHERAEIAESYRQAFANEGVAIDGHFAGLAAYAYPHFLSPLETQRELAFHYFERACDSALELGTTVIGSPLGGMSNKVSNSPQSRETAYNRAIELLYRLSESAQRKGISEIQIEATPLLTEFPHSPEVSLQLMKDLEESAVPFRILVDWGHALFRPLLGEQADMDLWFSTLKNYIGAIHLQQTDGLFDRHWDFMHEGGIITPHQILEATAKAGLDDVWQYLEVVTIFEETDEEIYRRMKGTMDFLHRELAA